MIVANIGSFWISISALVALVVLGFGGLFSFKSKMGGYWHEAYKEQKARADDFQEKYAEQRAAKHAALSELAAAKLKTDLTALIKAMGEQRTEITQQIDALRAEITAKLELVNEGMLATTKVLQAMEARIAEYAKPTPQGANR